ncbi:MAG: GNAT family N-acetyltransferase, partial [Gammaproteobacteria bacterium]|nr:GNAT family N-acetyltransferase [Gammaproteobacteria bacterium]
VLKPWRGRGIGKALLSRALEISKGEGLRRPFLNAQVPAMGFYRQMGFLEQGEVFMEAGITHRKMEWRG